ncbi:tetratricopeptide repeat protein [Aeromonas caviae]
MKKKAFLALLITCVYGEASLQAKDWSNESPDRVQQAAEQGDMDAQYRLGELYATLPHYEDQVLVWLTKAAEQGHAEAQFRLGRLHDGGVQSAFKMSEQEYMFAQMGPNITENMHTQALPWYRRGIYSPGRG